MLRRKKTSFSKLPAIAIDAERVPLVLQSEIVKQVAEGVLSAVPSALKHAADESEMPRRRSRSSGTGKESEPLIERSPEPRPDGKTNVEFVPEIVEKGDAVILEETEIPRHGKPIRYRDDRRSRLPTPPPTKNVSFGELQFVQKHSHSGRSGEEKVRNTIISRGNVC